MPADEPEFDAEDAAFDGDARRPVGILPDEDDDEDDPAADWAPVPAPRKATPVTSGNTRVVPPAPRPKTGQRIEREAQASLVADDDSFILPPLHFHGRAEERCP